MKDEFVAWLNGRPVTRGELRAAFDLVADPTDWKNPINAVVDPDEQTKVMIYEAVRFFTGCTPKFTRLSANRYRVTTSGFRAR
jgi:hypothetical protein